MLVGWVGGKEYGIEQKQKQKRMEQQYINVAMWLICLIMRTKPIRMAMFTPNKVKQNNKMTSFE